MSSPLVTIGCAVYNGEETLARAFDSLVGQEYENLEILVSDDCSKDRSREIIAEYAKRDGRINVLDNPVNVGVTRNFNRLAREARGKYFMWGDQDDIRDKSFVRKAVAALEADPDAVLCHSHTGVFMGGDPRDVKYIVTLHGVDGVRSAVQRYLRFLYYFSDTTIAGLMRTDALQRTHLYRDDVGSANALLFELLLQGKFIQIPEVLYYYSAKGIRNRPNAKAEYARANPGKEMPLLHFPFLVLAKNQSHDIMNARDLGALAKLEIETVLWGHTAAVTATKLLYRTVSRRIPIPESITALCDQFVEPKQHLVFLNGSENDEDVNPKLWVLKGGD